MKIKSKVTLGATLSKPGMKKDSYPAVLFVAGSGMVDRDGNAKKLTFNIYRRLSETLNALGFITLRYDKRGVGESEGDFYSVGVKDLLEDLDACVTFLKAQKDVNKVILLGHSEGCILSTLYSKDHDIDGMIQLAGAGIALETATSAQSKFAMEEIQNMKGLKGKLLRLILTEKKLKKAQDKVNSKMLKSTKDSIRVGFVKQPAKWIREHFVYQDEDIQNILKETSIPTLAVTGDKDVQADIDDLNKVEALNNPNISVVRINNMDHMLKEFKGEKTILSLLKQYKKEIDQPTHPILEETLVQWLNQFK